MAIIDMVAVNRVLLSVGEHCSQILLSLLIAMELTEAQLDELLTYVKKEKFWKLRRH